MAQTKTIKRPSGRPSRPRVCPDCLTLRPGYRPMKYPPPCPNCQSDKPPVRLTKSPQPPPPGELPSGPPGVLVPEIVQESGKVDLKGEFTVMELNFLEILLNGGVTIDDAMKSAGYGFLEERNRYYTANRILQKHVEQAGDLKKLARSCGLGEVQVILKIKQLMENPSATIQARGTELAAKILEMTSESIDLAQGIQIVIRTPDGKLVPPTPAGQVAPKQAPKALPASGPRVRMIK